MSNGEKVSSKRKIKEVVKRKKMDKIAKEINNHPYRQAIISRLKEGNKEMDK